MTPAESRVVPCPSGVGPSLLPAEDGPTSLLARFVADHKREQIPEPVLHAARRALVDHIGVTVSGSTDDATRRARDAVAASESGGGATVVGDRMRVSPPFAAFLNAFASHVLDLDDVYNPPGTTVHGSCSVWPAILAVADTLTGHRAADALASFAVGFEVGDAGRTRRRPDALRRRLARHGYVRSRRRGRCCRPHDGPRP